jgi:chromate transport protein ChrA
MSLLLMSVFGVVAIAVLAMAQPDARNLASIKIGAVGLVLAVVCATFWHEHVVAVVVGFMFFALLFVLWRGITWPIRYIASVFASAFRRPQ